MNFFYNWEDINLAFDDFLNNNPTVAQKNKKFFLNGLYPYLKEFVEHNQPLFEFFEKKNSGIHKEVYIFSDFVIKLTHTKEIIEEEKRKSMSNFCEEGFLDNYIILFPKEIKNNFNSLLQLEYINCLIIQKKITPLSWENIKNKNNNKHIIVNKEWLFSFIRTNCLNKNDSDILINFLSSIDITNNNIGYDENNKPVLFDW